MSLSIAPELLESVKPKVAGRLLGLWETRTPNIFRSVVEIQSKSGNHAAVSEEIRLIVKEEFSPGLIIPFAFGTVLHFESNAPSEEEMLGYVDTKARSRGTWQWLIVADQARSSAFGIHTWTAGYLTPVYASLLKQLEAKGYACRSVTKPPDKFFVNLWRLSASLGKARTILLGLGAVLALGPVNTNCAKLI